MPREADYAFHMLKDIRFRKGLCAHWPGREAYTVRYSMYVVLNIYAVVTSARDWIFMIFTPFSEEGCS